MKLTLKTCACHDPDLTLANCIYLHPDDAKALTPVCNPYVDGRSKLTYALLRKYVYVVRGSDQVERGYVMTSSVQRRLVNLALMDPVDVVAYVAPDPKIFITSLELTVDWLARPRLPSLPPRVISDARAAELVFSTSNLADMLPQASDKWQGFVKHFFTVGQIFIMQVRGIPLEFTVDALKVGDDNTAFGVCHHDCICDGGPPELQCPGRAHCLPSPVAEPEQEGTRGMLTNFTEIHIKRAPGSALKLDP